MYDNRNLVAPAGGEDGLFVLIVDRLKKGKMKKKMPKKMSQQDERTL